MKDLKESFLDKLSGILAQLEKSNFFGCIGISTNIIRYSEFIEFDDGIMIGEFYESLFSNLCDIKEEYDIEKEDLLKPKDSIADSLKLIIDSNLDINDDYKLKIYNAMTKARVDVTSMQFRYFDLKKPKTNIPKIGGE